MLGKTVESSYVKGLICKRHTKQHTQVYLSHQAPGNFLGASPTLYVEKLQSNSGLKVMHTVKSLRRKRSEVLENWPIRNLSREIENKIRSVFNL